MCVLVVETDLQIGHGDVLPSVPGADGDERQQVTQGRVGLLAPGRGEGDEGLMRGREGGRKRGREEEREGEGEREGKGERQVREGDTRQRWGWGDCPAGWCWMDEVNAPPPTVSLSSTGAYGWCYSTNLYGLRVVQLLISYRWCSLP